MGDLFIIRTAEYYASASAITSMEYAVMESSIRKTANEKNEVEIKGAFYRLETGKVDFI